VAAVSCPVRLVVALVVTSGLPAAAQTIYRWTDADGAVHYSDDPSAAPKKADVKTTQGDELMSVHVEKTPANEQGGARADVDPEEQRANDERYWRGQFQDARDAIRLREAEVATDERQADPREHGCTRSIHRVRQGLPANEYDDCDFVRSGERARAQERLSADRSKLAVAKKLLDDLVRRATYAGVPFEWRR
jgi:hypothetical protein